MKYKILFTFGSETPFYDKAILFKCNDVEEARKVVFDKYGRLNISKTYHYDVKSLKNGCKWKEGLFEIVKNNYVYGRQIIKKYNLKVENYE